MRIESSGNTSPYQKIDQSSKDKLKDFNYIDKLREDLRKCEEEIYIFDPITMSIVKVPTVVVDKAKEILDQLTQLKDKLKQFPDEESRKLVDKLEKAIPDVQAAINHNDISALHSAITALETI